MRTLLAPLALPVLVIAFAWPAWVAAQAAEPLIATAHKDPAKKPQLAKALMSGHVMIIATTKGPNDKSITIQDFSRKGQSFIPFFSNEKHFKDETRGSGFESKGLLIDANMFASMLKGTETLILNPGSKTLVEFQAAQLKTHIDPSRLPKRK